MSPTPFFMSRLNRDVGDRPPRGARAHLVDANVTGVARRKVDGDGVLSRTRGDGYVGVVIRSKGKGVADRKIAASRGERDAADAPDHAEVELEPLAARLRPAGGPARRRL